MIDCRVSDINTKRLVDLKSTRFYAPWCVHCKNLKPEYEKAAKSLKDLAQVAAVNCDDESNKAFCGSMGVQGFPTLKIVKPSKKKGKPIVEDYQGPRESKGIVEQVKAAIPNNVKRITDKALKGWLESSNDTAKVILFSSKGTTGALVKVLASEFLGKVNFAQIRDKEKGSVDMFGITDYPTLVVLPGGAQEPVKYDGAFSKKALLDFVGQYASANSDPSDAKQKPLKAEEKTSAKPKDEQEQSSSESRFSESSASQKSSEAADDPAAATSETLEDNSNPTESPKPAVTSEEKPIPVPEQPEPLPALIEERYLREICLGERTSICALALLPQVDGDDGVLPVQATTALSSLSKLAQKHATRGTKIFPFYSIPSRNTGSALLRDSLKLSGSDTFELIAINSRRGWWRKFEGEDFDTQSVETWIDNIRFGEGPKSTLPNDLVGSEKEQEASATEEDTSAPTHGEL